MYCYIFRTHLEWYSSYLSHPRIVGNKFLFPTYSIVTRPRVPPRQSCRNLRFAGVLSGTLFITFLKKCTATFSSYLSHEGNPVFGASAQRISRPSYTVVVTLNRPLFKIIWRFETWTVATFSRPLPRRGPQLWMDVGEVHQRCQPTYSHDCAVRSSAEFHCHSPPGL